MNLNVMQSLVTVALSTLQEPWMGTIPTLINEALNQIQQKRSWNCMKGTVTFSLSAGQTSYALPSTFKELQSGANSMRATSQTSYFGNSLWRIFTKQEVARLTQIGVNVADRTAWIEQDLTGIWTVYFPSLLAQGALPPDAQFTIDTYNFLAPISLPTDENDLMRRYPMLVIEWCKMLVFSLGSDKASIDGKVEALRMIFGASTGWTGYFSQASADDNSHAIRGRTARFGGF